jgi:lipoate-protein ligase A
MERSEILSRMVDTFRGLYGLTESDITSEELARAEELVVEKFGTEEWLQRVP